MASPLFTSSARQAPVAIRVARPARLLRFACVALIEVVLMAGAIGLMLGPGSGAGVEVSAPPAPVPSHGDSQRAPAQPEPGLGL